MRRGLFAYLFCAAVLAVLITYVSAGDPRASLITPMALESNTTTHYDTDGYVTLNWTFVNGSSQVIAQNFTVWASSGAGYATNGTNTSATISGANIIHGFDFHGTSGNWTFLIEPFNNTGSSGQKASYNSSWKWLVIDKSAASGFNITDNSSNYYDTDGYVTLNWSYASGPASKNYTIWISTNKGTTYTQNGTNTSATGFDFYGSNGANYTFRVQWLADDGGMVVHGSNLTWANGSHWFSVEKAAATTPTVSSLAYVNYDEGYVTFNWTAPTTSEPINNYTLWLSTDDGVTYTQNSSNTSATGVDFYGIEANYTHAKIGWSGGADGSVFSGSNLTRGDGALWLQIDKSVPSVTFSCTDGVAGSITCSCSATDALSGMASTIYTANPTGSSAGTHSTTCTATDNVGNAGSATTTYTVIGSSNVTPTSIQPSMSRLWDKIEPNTPVIMLIDKEGIELTQIQIEILNEANDVKVTVEKLAEQPATVTQTVSGNVYHYMEISTNNLDEENIQNIIINFKVNKTWMEQNSIDKSTVLLNRWADSQWNELETSILDEDDDYVYYEATSPGFSYFTISGQGAGAAPCDNDGTCEPEQGETSENCPNDCPTDETVCTPSDMRCSGDNLQQCNEYGTAWVTTTTCEHGCSGAQCNDAPAAGGTWIIIAVVAVVVAVVVISFVFKP